MKKTKFRRRKYLITPAVQLPASTLLFVGYLGIVGITLYFANSSINSMKEMIEQTNMDGKSLMFDSLESHRLFMIGLSLIPPVFFGIFAFLTTVFLSHRSAGPIYSLHKSVKENLESESPVPMGIRKTDQYQDLSHDYNKLLKKLWDKAS